MRRAWVVVVMMAASGCTGRQQGPAADGPVTRAASPFDTERCVVRVPGKRVLQEWNESGGTGGDRLGIEQAGSDGEWVTERVLLAKGGKRQRLRVQSLTDTGQGGVVMTLEENHAEKVVVEFDPPLVVYPAGLAAGGRPYAQELRMTVRSLADRRRVRSRGDARNEVVYEGVQTIETPAGAFQAMKLRSTFTADLQGAKVTNVTDQWFVPDIGLVAERRTERTLIMGVAGRNNSEAWVLESQGGAGVAEPASR